MKMLIVALVVSLSASAAKATDWGDFTVKISVGQTIAAVVQQTLNASSNVTSNRNNKIAEQIQNDVQDYNQSGEVSAFLAQQIAMVQSINAELSEQESVDVLVAASDLILN